MAYTHGMEQAVRTVEEYLAGERQSEIKHEYYQGQLFAMAGATRRHNLIVANVVGELRSALRQRPCEVYPSDMRVKVADTGLYTYPDASALCCEPVFDDSEEDTLENPQLLVEVLSRSTEAYDRGKKFKLYRAIPTLADYLLLSQDEILVEHFARQPDGTWNLRIHQAGERIRIGSLQCELAVDELYLKVPLDEPSADG